MRVEAETLHELEILAAVDACRGEHVVGDGCVGPALEGPLAVVAQYAAPAREADERFRIDKAVNRHDAAELVVGELWEVLVGGAGNRVQNVDRGGLDAEFTQVEAHVDAVFHRLAESHDASAADLEPRGERVLEGRNLVVVGVRGTHVGEMPAVGFQVVVEAGEARLFQLVELLAVQKPCREAHGKLRLFFEAADGLADLFHVAVRERTARSHDGVARNAGGFFLLRVFHDFVGAEKLVFRGAGVVVAALGAVLAVFGAASAARVHDGAEVKIVAVEFLADLVRRVAKFFEVFIEQLYRLFAVDFVTAQNLFLEFLDKRPLYSFFPGANIEKGKFEGPAMSSGE